MPPCPRFSQSHGIEALAAKEESPSSSVLEGSPQLSSSTAVLPRGPRKSRVPPLLLWAFLASDLMKAITSRMRNSHVPLRSPFPLSDHRVVL
ncbi:LOW QUALITY PROTEIN: hypothetical protein MC885_007492 [Smutsia gigantea]|nr:LOW QUALITY PROTEIN: hypothetical protein MC885_007492 [Smutsia gigantea]